VRTGEVAAQLASAVLGTRFLQFDNEVVDLCQELFAAGVRAMRDQFRGMLGQLLFARQAGPTPHFTVQQQCKSTQVTVSARVAKIAEQILESKPQLQR
jgi:hypothetical protein